MFHITHNYSRQDASGIVRRRSEATTALDFEMI
jgi:hypothetical protein